MKQLTALYSPPMIANVCTSARSQLNVTTLTAMLLDWLCANDWTEGRLAVM